jgi:hypothetical protein
MRSFRVRQLAAAFRPASLLGGISMGAQFPASKLAGGKAAASCRTPKLRTVSPHDCALPHRGRRAALTIRNVHLFGQPWFNTCQSEEVWAARCCADADRADFWNRYSGGSVHVRWHIVDAPFNASSALDLVGDRSRRLRCPASNASGSVAHQ